MSRRQRGRATALPDGEADRRIRGSAHATDVQDVWSDETRLDRFRDRGVDQVLLAVRKALQAQAEDREQRRDGPFQELRDRAHGSLIESDRDRSEERRVGKGW